MPDRYDPKLSVRPLGERKSDAARTDDDPLAELARIVTGRSTFEPAPAGGGSRSAGSTETSSEANLANDLESELLNDLQASFAALGEPFEGEPDRSPAEPEARDVAPPLPSEPSNAPESPGSHYPRDAFEQSVEDVLAELEGVSRLDHDRSPEPAEPAPLPKPPPTWPPALERPEPLSEPEESLLEFEESLPEPEETLSEPEEPPPPPPAVVMPRRESAIPRRPAPPAERPPVPERPALSERYKAAEQQPPAERPNLSRLRLRPAPPPVRPMDAEESAATRKPDQRRDRMDRALRAPDGLSRFAPPRSTAPIPAEPTPEPEMGLEDTESFGEAPELDDPNAVFDDEFTLADLDTAAFAPEDDLPPFPEEELAGLKRRRSSRALAAVGGILVVALIGGGAFYFFQDDGATGSPPPIITADGGPSKVFPDDAAAGETDQQGKLIYDRVDEGGGSGDTTLVATGNDPIAKVSPDAEMADNPITRVIIPGGPAIDGPLQDTGDGSGVNAETVVADADPSGESDPGLGPKKVRTVVVRPDGTIVSSEAVDEGGGDAVPDAPDAAAADDFSSLTQDTRNGMDAVLDGEDLPVVADPLGMTGEGDAPAVADETPAPGTVPAADEAVVAVEEAPEPAPAPVAKAPEPVRAVPIKPKPAAPTVVATTGSANGPIDLTPGTSARSSNPQAGSGGVLVQVSAQRTEDAARSTYRSLQARYPSILGPYQAAIIRADLGDRGIYYRVRIGPFSGNDATRLCDDLKSAGGECILAR